MSFTFTGDSLPEYVSFNVTGHTGVGIYGSAYDEIGNEVASFRSDGFWGLPELSSPAIPGQLIELQAGGIKTITVGNLYNRRGYTNLDNLYFGEARPVTGPASWPLLVSSVLGLWLLRRRKPLWSARAFSHHR